MWESLYNMSPEACNFIKKETPTPVFSCEFDEIFKNNFFIEYLWWLLLQLQVFCLLWTFFIMLPIAQRFSEYCITWTFSITASTIKTVVRGYSVNQSFAKFTGKHLCRSLSFIKLQNSGLQLYYFPVKVAKSLRTPIL